MLTGKLLGRLRWTDKNNGSRQGRDRAECKYLALEGGAPQPGSFTADPVTIGLLICPDAARREL